LKQTARSFLRDAKISGEEYLNLTSSRKMKLTGIEDINLYARNLEAYAELAGKRQTILSYLVKSRDAVEKLKKRYYPYQLISYEKNAARTQSPETLIDLARACTVDFSSFSELTKLSSLSDQEKRVDFHLAQLELAAIL